MHNQFDALLNCFVVELSWFDSCFPHSNGKILLQDWQQPLPSSALSADTVEEIDNLKHTKSLNTAGFDFAVETTKLSMRTRKDFESL